MREALGYMAIAAAVIWTLFFVVLLVIAYVGLKEG